MATSCFGCSRNVNVSFVVTSAAALNEDLRLEVVAACAFDIVAYMVAVFFGGEPRDSEFAAVDAQPRKGAIKWTRLSCRTFAANAVRLQLHALAYNLGNFLRTLATPEPIKDWSLTSLKEKLIKIGAKVVSHGRYVIFQMAEVAIPRQMFQEILRLIAELRPQPPPAPA